MQQSASSPSKLSVQEFRRDLRSLEREVLRQLEGETTCCGVSLPQCHVLLELSRQDLSLTALAGALDLDKSTLSRTVESLVQAALVERSTVATNRRLVRLALTKQGRQKVESVNDLCNRYYGALLGELSERDQREAVRIVRLLAEAMSRLRNSLSVPACCSSTRLKPKRSGAETATNSRTARRQDTRKGLSHGV